MRLSKHPFLPSPTLLSSTKPNTLLSRMRPSSRLVSTLTIFSWSLESTYASFRTPDRSLYRRQFRTADWSTSIRPSHKPSNGVKFPEAALLHPLAQA
ncbi:hypothetical protein H2248_005257 [Termitomyces sp. 'cryptogamus']|nr:hypothetical protein H2248_005257 [Termitomyces sp. 'cryptogamus']